jgi:FtsH-binding integral membrane protein
MSSDSYRSPEMVAAAQRSFMVRVYGWMTLGLLVTASAALFTLSQPALLQGILSTPFMFLGLLFLELAMVVALTAMIAKLGVTTAYIGFLAYAALNGVTLSILALVYTATSIAQVFVIAAGIFGLMSLYGYTTQRDLTAWRNLLFMGLLGVILALLVNLFLRNSMLDFVLSIVGVLVFVGLTAYDTQKLKKLGVSVSGSGEMVQKTAVIGALALYLDFINIFLWLLRLFGQRR